MSGARWAVSLVAAVLLGVVAYAGGPTGRPKDITSERREGRNGVARWLNVSDTSQLAAPTDNQALTFDAATGGVDWETISTSEADTLDSVAARGNETDEGLAVASVTSTGLTPTVPTTSVVADGITVDNGEGDSFDIKHVSDVPTWSGETAINLNVGGGGAEVQIDSSNVNVTNLVASDISTSTASVGGGLTFGDPLTGGAVLSPGDEAGELYVGTASGQRDGLLHAAVIRLDNAADIAVNGSATAIAMRAGNDTLALPALSRRWVRSHTSGYALEASDGDSLLADVGAGAQVQYDLLELSTLPLGTSYTFLVTTANGVRVMTAAASDDVIRVGGVGVSGAAGYAQSTTIGSSLTITRISDTVWFATSVAGTWTVSP